MVSHTVCDRCGLIQTLPIDLVAVVAATILVNVAVFAPIVRETPLRILLGLPFALFVPGYALVSAVFPKTRQPLVRRTGAQSDRRAIQTLRGSPRYRWVRTVYVISGVERHDRPVDRIGAEFHMGIRLLPIMVSVSAFTLLASMVAAMRRWQLRRRTVSAPVRTVGDDHPRFAAPDPSRAGMRR